MEFQELLAVFMDSEVLAPERPEYSWRRNILNITQNTQEYDHLFMNIFCPYLWPLIT